MKIAVILLLFVNVFLIAGAVLRVATATEDTPPLIDFAILLPSANPRQAPAPEPRPAFGDQGTTGGEVIGTISGRRVDEVMMPGAIGADARGGGSNMNAVGSLERASERLDRREDDLGEARQAIGNIGRRP